MVDHDHTGHGDDMIRVSDLIACINDLQQQIVGRQGLPDNTVGYVHFCTTVARLMTALRAMDPDHQGAVSRRAILNVLPQSTCPNDPVNDLYARITEIDARVIAANDGH